MKLVPDERNLPRIHLVGTLAMVLLLILLLASLFAWQGWRAQGGALRNIEAAAQQQIQARLQSEMDSMLAVIDFTRNRTELTLRRSLVAQVDAAYGVAQGIHERESPRRSQAEVQQLILEALRPARFFDGRGYVFVNDMQGHIRLLPPNPEYEGKLNLRNQDDTGRPVMGSLIEAARKPRGEGWASYRWYSLENPAQMADKLSYVRHFAAYDWLIGVGDYLHYWEDYQRGEALDLLLGRRFGSSGHVSVTSTEGQVIQIPNAPHFKDKRGEYLPEQESEVVAQVTRLALGGGGFLSYEWPDPVTRVNIRKTALVRLYQPWGWVLTVTMRDDELTAPVRQELEQQKLVGREQGLLLLLVTALASLVAVAGSLGFSRWMGQLFHDYHRRNLQQQDALREGEERLNTILETVDAAIFIKDLDYRYTYANRKACDIIGLQQAEVIGRHDAELMGLGPGPMTREGDRRVLQQGERVMVEWAREINGRSVALATVKLPLRDVNGRIYALCGVTTDVSERKRMERVLAQARDAAEAANRAKSDFLSNVSHELRTPLNSIIGMLHLVFGTTLTGQQQNYLRQLQQAGQQLHDIIVDMLDFSSLDNGRLQLQLDSFLLDQLLRQLESRQVALATAKGLRFSIEVAAGIPQQLVGDSRRLAKALGHYLENAIKFTDRGDVGLRILWLQRDAHSVLLRFEVSDSGIGVDESRREQLFRHVEQGDGSSTRRHGGAGLGLVLVRQLAELMGGEVGCDSRSGCGAVFWFTARLGCSGSQAQDLPPVCICWPQPAALATQPSPAGAQVDDPQPWQDLRQQLLALLRDDDVDSLELFERNEILLRHGLGKRHAEFAQCIRSYDFPAALRLLEG